MMMMMMMMMMKEKKKSIVLLFGGASILQQTRREKEYPITVAQRSARPEPYRPSRPANPRTQHSDREEDPGRRRGRRLHGRGLPL